MLQLHSLIDKNSYDPGFGRLLHHRDSQNPNILHYSVQLNNLEALAWEPIHPNHQKDRGKLAIWRIDWNQFQDAKWVNILEKEKINQSLHISVDHFHEHWQYDLFRFNCEHWARLLATGDCRCCQIKEFKKMQKIPVIGTIAVGVAGIVTGAWEHNGYAQELIEQEIRHLSDCR